MKGLTGHHSTTSNDSAVKHFGSHALKVFSLTVSPQFKESSSLNEGGSFDIADTEKCFLVTGVMAPKTVLFLCTTKLIQALARARILNVVYQYPYHDYCIAETGYLADKAGPHTGFLIDRWRYFALAYCL